MDDRKEGGRKAAFREVIPEATTYDGGEGGLTWMAAPRWIFPKNGGRRRTPSAFKYRDLKA